MLYVCLLLKLLEMVEWIGVWFLIMFINVDMNVLWFVVIILDWYFRLFFNDIIYLVVGFIVLVDEYIE